MVRSAAETTTTRGLDQVVAIETPEQVVFSYTVAGIGSRAAAAMIDYGIIITMMLLIALLDIYIISPAFEVRSGTEALTRQAGGWVVAFVLILQFVLMWGYYVLFEALWDGQTPGKRWLGLRVVQDGGYSVSFASSAARNITRALDMQPILTYLVAMISIAVSRTGKRLGDQLAGTLVVRERIVPITDLVESQRATVAHAPATAHLSDEELELLSRFIARTQSLDAKRREQLSTQLGERFKTHLAGSTNVAVALRQLHDRERLARVQGAGARGDTGAAREQYRLIAEGTPRWNRFAQKLAEAQRRRLRNLSVPEVVEFVAQYREVATDLARLSSAGRGRELDAVFRLSRLVAGGHNLLYRQQQLATRSILQFIFVTVPAELRRSWAPILTAAVLFFGSGLVAGMAVVNNPSLIEELVSPGMIDRAEHDAARAQTGDRRYVDVEDYARPMLASRVLSNNVQVAFMAFASGLSAGVITLLILLMNGVSIGSVMGLFAVKGVLDVIGDFVIAHSVFELSAICISAGGGFLIAKAILLPGAITRREALVVNGRRALRLLTAAALFLLFAGAIEGLISPRSDLPFGFKLGVAGFSALVMTLYTMLSGGVPPAS